MRRLTGIKVIFGGWTCTEKVIQIRNMDSDSSSMSPSHRPSPAADETASTICSPSTAQFQARSCYACRRRKIRCDKVEQCSACKRAGKICEYPAAGPRVRRTRQTIIADMASRISELERSLAIAQKSEKARSISAPLAPNTATALNCSRLGQDFGASKKREEDVIVQKGSSSQYFNEVLLSRVIRRVSVHSSALDRCKHG